MNTKMYCRKEKILVYSEKHTYNKYRALNINQYANGLIYVYIY